MSNREYLKKIASETLEVVNAGYYVKSDTSVELSKPKKGYLFTFKMLKSIDLVNVPRQGKGIVVVENKKTVDSIIEMSEYTKDIGVLNFASAHNPGGGFLTGAMAQEESLAYSSNLYHTLKDSNYYLKNVHYLSKFYIDDVIYSEVEFFRDSNFDYLVKPISTKVITSAAVNVNKLNFLDTKYEDVMYRRMEFILKLFAHIGCKNIILGAYGCGVFGNKAEFVAEVWKKLLYGENKYIEYFDNVVFSVYDSEKSNNYAVFNEILKY